VQQIGGELTSTAKQPDELFEVGGLRFDVTKRQTSNKKPQTICSSFCDGFFLISFYACASQFYDAFFSYHTAYENVFLIINKFSFFISTRQ
jgi:hypothetical protein